LCQIDGSSVACGGKPIRILQISHDKYTLFSANIFVGFVPSPNLGKNPRMLCIRLGNLQFAKFHKSCANLKKIGYPNFLAV
jgi:hypothetical protein